MSFPNASQEFYFSHTYSVSILVLVDVLPERQSLPTSVIPAPGFNPCFSGCPSRTHCGAGCRLSRLTVSILVLVDVLPEPYPSSSQNRSPLRFNPCFSGCPSRTGKSSARPLSRQLCFNPCFSGCPSRTRPDNQIWIPPNMFQSLF